MAMDASGEGYRMQQAWDQSWQNDGKCHVLFHKQTVLDERATSGWTEERELVSDDGIVTIKKIRHAGAGRPIYVEKDFARKFTPGDQFNVVDQEVTERDRLEYEKQWLDYLAGNEQGVTGTPLTAWSLIPRAIVEELKHFQVRTVEDLAGLADVHCQKFAGIVGWKQKARDFLQAAQSAAPIAEMRAELSQRDDQIAALKQQMSELTKMLEAQTAPKAKDAPAAQMKRGG